MSFFEQCKQCSVIVNGGSGVLFQPMTEKYSYILTAKHNLYNGKKETNTKNIKFCLYQQSEKQDIIDKYEHRDLDIAILKIEKIDFESPDKVCTKPSDRDKLKFYGYPENQRNEYDNIKHFNLEVGDILGQEIIAKNDEYYEQSYINGCSGGGVFEQNDETFTLIGIECRMDKQYSNETNNTRLRFILIQSFDSIIEGNDLAPLHPPFMKDFKLLSDNIFQLNNFENKRNLLRGKLKYLVEQATKEIKPYDINNEFSDDLFVKGHEKNNISKYELWSMYLEFILLAIVLDKHDNIDIKKIKEVYKKRKILFAKAENWIKVKDDILKSDLSVLEKNGIVLIACDGDRRPYKDELSAKTIQDIGNPPQKKEMRIDNAVDYIKDIKYKHIYAVEKHILDNESKFNDSTSIDIENTIKEVLKDVFR